MKYFRIVFSNEYCGEVDFNFLEAENEAEAAKYAEETGDEHYPEPAWYLDMNDFETKEEYDAAYEEFTLGNRCFIEEIDEEESHICISEE